MTFASTSIRSIGFSGAGFLTCYHIGAAACLLKHGLLSAPGETRKGNGTTTAARRLTGVSGGALVVAAMGAGVHPEDGMQTMMNIAQRTREGGFLDMLHPGFSLVDEVEERFTRLMKQSLGGTESSNFEDYDVDLLMNRIEGGKTLRIGMTDRRMFPLAPQNRLRAYVYVDAYRSVEDIVAACILSSYVPGFTGPIRGSRDPKHRAIVRSQDRIVDMIQSIEAVKHGESGQPIALSSSDNRDARQRELFWDGGIFNLFPVYDKQTLIVTPIGARFARNPFISPSIGRIRKENDVPDENVTGLGNILKTIRVTKEAEFEVSTANVEVLRRILLSSSDSVMQERYSQGYDDATTFLADHNLLKSFSEGTSSISSAGCTDAAQLAK